MLRQAREQIESYSVPLDPSTFPSDADIAEHAHQLELWKAKQTRLLALAKAATERESIRPKAIALHKQLNDIHFAISNLTTIAEGRKPGQIEGGLYRVGEDFLAVS